MSSDEFEQVDAQAQGEETRPPNILCFVMDQLRFDHLGCYGNEKIRTPHLDRLATEGVIFDRAYVANPLCMPARASLWTGLSPRQHGVRTNGIPLRKDIPTLTGALREAGYHTHSVGKIHLTNYDAPTEKGETTPDLTQWAESKKAWEQGAVTYLPENYYGLESGCFLGGHGNYIFGEYINWINREHPELLPKVRGEEVLEDWREKCGGEQAYKSAVPEEKFYNRFIADKTCDFLDAKKKDERPFFCWCSFPDPHHPYAAPQPYCDWYDPNEMPLPTRKNGEMDALPPFYRMMYEDGASRWGSLSGRSGATDVSDDALRHMTAMTYAMVSCVDAAIGRVMQKLEELELRENTVVVLLSDHGDMMGDHWMLNKGPFHFEGLLRMPMVWSWKGKFPTGVRTDGLASQIDFMPTVLDLCQVPAPEGRVSTKVEAAQQRDALPGKSLAPVLLGQEKKVRDWVSVENDEDYLGTNLRTFITNRYKITLYTGHDDWGELFDLRNDPKELNNLWSDPNSQELKRALMAKYMQCYLEEESGLPRRLGHA